MIIGDILMSSDHEKENLTLPTFFDGITEVLGNDVKDLQAALQQKVYIIKDTLAIALAGNLKEMEYVLE